MSGEIETLREKISSVDEQIVELLAERVKLAKEVGRLKGCMGKPVTDRRREGEVYMKVKLQAEKLGLNPGDCEEVFKKIVRMCKRVQFKL